MKPKIIITVAGGNVEDVSSNQDIDLIIIDYDNVDVGVKPVSDVLTQDFTFESGEAHKLYTNAADPVEMEIKDELKRIHF